MSRLPAPAMNLWYFMHIRQKKICCSVVVCVSLLLLAGCVAEKTMIPPYQGPARAEAARDVHEPLPVRQRTTGDPAGVEQRSSEPSVEDTDVLLPVLTRINERIFSYEQKLATVKNLEGSLAALADDRKKQDKLTGCQQQIEDILAGYNRLHQQLLHRDSIPSRVLFSGNDLLDLEKKDFGFLEGDCGRLLAQEHPENALAPLNKEVVTKKERAISAAYAAGEYKKTIDLYEQLASRLSGSIPYDLTFAYGQALMKTGRESEARKVFTNLLSRIRRQDQAQWEFTLMQLIGDLDFALGSYEPAKKQYNEIVDAYQGLAEKNEWAKQQLAALDVSNQQSREVKAYAELLRSFLAYNPDRDGYTVVKKAEAYLKAYPYSLVSSSVDHLVTINRKQADAWYNKLLQQVDRLAAEKRFQDALLVIERIPRLILPIDKQQELATRARKLRTAEAINRETTVLAQEQEAQENWNAGMTALGAREYDKAIEAFTKVLGTSYDDRARKKIDEAANLAAREDRRRAAELFVRSGRTHDLWSRKKLLLASRRLLQDILVKYPQADIVGKVKRNLHRIDEEITKIDPDLLSAPMTVGGGLAEPADKAAGIKPDKEGQKSELPPARAVQPDTVRE